MSTDSLITDNSNQGPNGTIFQPDDKWLQAQNYFDPNCKLEFAPEQGWDRTPAAYPPDTSQFFNQNKTSL